MKSFISQDKSKERQKPKVIDHYGKMPPQNIEAEKAILGSIMLEKGAFERASDLIFPECFYLEAHQLIFRTMAAMSLANKPLDIIMISEELRKREELEQVGGPYYVTTLTNSVVNSYHMENHINVVYEKYLKRELIKQGNELMAAAYDDSEDVYELIDSHEKDFQQLTLHHAGNVITDMTPTLVERLQRLHDLQEHSYDVIGIPSGFQMLDRVTHGWQKNNLIILAARPAVGKTALALNLARNAVMRGTASAKKVIVCFFSLEMSKGQLVDRMLSAQSEMPLEKIKTGKIELKDLNDIVYRKGIQPLAPMGIYIDDTAALNIYQLRSKARYVKRKHGANAEMLIIVDYLQLMSGTDRKGGTGNREQEISHISRNLKGLAKDMDIPIIALSQLSRAVETRGSKEGGRVPQLSDLRESGAIEQDADMVMFIYRPEYYDIPANEIGESTKGLTEISIAKNRDGPLATGSEAIKLKALLHIQKFEEWKSLDDVKAHLPAGGAWRPVDDVSKKDLDFS